MIDFIFISMPYARFDSAWFSRVPNINLGISEALLNAKGKKVKTFHFHLDFLPFLKTYNSQIENNFKKLSQLFGVEYLSLDYVFASILFEDKYLKSKEEFQERLSAVGLSIDEFETLRDVARSFIDYEFSKISEYIKETKLIGFSCSHYQLSGSLLMSLKIKKANPDVFIIVGGKDCSGAFGYELLSNVKYIDFVGTSECEITILNLLDYIDGKSNTLFNVLFRDETGKIKVSKLLPNFDLNSLPPPQYPFEEFPLTFEEIILPLELGRGCPWGNCTFCPDKSYNIKCRSKKPEKVIEEIEYYQNISKKLRNFIILDPDSLKDSESILKISKHLKGRKLSFHFAEFRAKRMSKNVMKALLDFGDWISPFQVGIESFSDRVLRLMKKGITVLKNVEVLKNAAELNIPLQFNLFTSFPLMSMNDLHENLRVMDSITHLLVCPNISIYPGEFYLPTDCEIFFNISQYGLVRDVESVFSGIFNDFEMPSFSNYPYPYLFNNEEEQRRISLELRQKVDEIQSKSPGENFMYYKDTSDGLEIVICRDGQKNNYFLGPKEKEIYLAAVEMYQDVKELANKLGLKTGEIYDILNKWESKGLILFSKDKKLFLSLAMKKPCNISFNA